MKRHLCPFFFVALLSLFAISCEKDDVSIESGLRIKKIIDDDGIESIIMEFTYNAEGLVTEIKEGNFLLDIDYDESNRPISVGEVGGDYYGIDWGNNN